jgi:hypothetical protein
MAFASGDRGAVSKVVAARVSVVQIRREREGGREREIKEKKRRQRLEKTDARGQSRGHGQRLHRDGRREEGHE